MYLGLHEIPQRSINKAVALNVAQPVEFFRLYVELKVPAAISGSGMPGVLVRFIGNGKRYWLKCTFQPVANVIDAFQFSSCPWKIRRQTATS